MLTSASIRIIIPSMQAPFVDQWLDEDDTDTPSPFGGLFSSLPPIHELLSGKKTPDSRPLPTLPPLPAGYAAGKLGWWAPLRLLRPSRPSRPL